MLNTAFSPWDLFDLPVEHDVEFKTDLDLELRDRYGSASVSLTVEEVEVATELVLPEIFDETVTGWDVISAVLSRAVTQSEIDALYSELGAYVEMRGFKVPNSTDDRDRQVAEHLRAILALLQD